MPTHRTRRPPARPALALLLAAASLLPACSGSPPTHRTVTVTNIYDVWSGPDSSSQVASDWETSVEALGADGATVYPGTATGPGTWAIAGVPVGPYTLHVTWTNGLNLYFPSSADVFDLGGDGSPAVINPASFGTVASFSWASLQPWDPAADQVQIFSYDASVWDLIYPVLTAGATSGGADYDWGYYVQSLLEPTDTLYAAQMRSAPVGAAGDTASTAVASASLTGAYLLNGAFTYLPTMTFAPPHTRGALRARWNTSAFDQAVPGAHQTFGYRLQVASQPPPSAVSPYRYLVLLGVTPPSGVLLADRDDGTISYGRIAPPSWTELVMASFYTIRKRAAPGAKVATEFGCGAWIYAPIGAVPDPIAPAVSSVQAITVGGKDASVTQAGVGTEPVVAWAAPAVGTPTSVQVRIRELDPIGTRYMTTPIATFVTTGTSVKVPAGLLQAGKAYVAILDTVSSPADRPSTAPYRRGLPWSQVTTVTEVFTP